MPNKASYLCYNQAMRIKEMFDEAHEIVGWIGTVLILLAYFLLSIGQIQAESALYQMANALGGIFLVYASVKTKDFPLIVLNAIWFLIAVYALLKLI